MEELQPQCMEEPRASNYLDAPTSYKEELHRHSVSINEGVVGYQLNIGCQTASFEDVDKTIKVANYLLKNKVECIRAYQQNKLTELVTKILA